MNRRTVLHAACVLLAVEWTVSAAEPKIDYGKQIAPIFRKYCVGCHNSDDREGKLDLSTFTALKRGGKTGAVVVVKDVAKSRLIGMIEGRLKPAMPPKDNEAPTKREIALLKTWVKTGAPGPIGISPSTALVVPKIQPTGKVRRPIHSIAVARNGRWIAVARHGVVEVVDARSRKPLRTLKGHTGDVTDVVVSNDGRLLAAASGEPGLFGEATVWNTRTWKVAARLKGHRDALYAVALSPDGKTLATGSYDQKIKLWNLATRKELRQLDGHNGPVHDLAFHPSGRLLASASGDRTVKLWNVATGRRLDTLGQPEKDQYAVAFSPDGKQVVAGGVDNRIRVWAVTRMGREGTNPLLYSRFAHRAAILRLVFAPDGKRLVSSSEDRTVRLWDTKAFTQLRSIKNQSDWVTSLAVSPDGRALFLGRLDGSLSTVAVSGSAGPASSVRPIRLVPVPQTPVRTPTGATVREIEPNDTPKTAQRISAATTVHGVFDAPGKRRADADLYRFRANAGRSYVLETNAARSKSPADTKIEVLHPDGRPVLRYRLRAVRDSSITFRPIDSRQTQVRVTNWEEMTLNQYLYMGGEVCRLFLMPRGPDSGFQFYAHRGKRRTYFGTSATVHAKDDPVYIVEVYPAGTNLVENGLPVFPVYYTNDDDGDRELGNDSRLIFTAPNDGDYLVRVTDVKGHAGRDYKYSLTIRPPKPDFKVTLSGAKATVPSGSGQRLTVNVDRIDGFNGEIRVHVSGLPQGYHVTSPIVVQADHLSANGVITVDGWVAATVRPTPKRKKGAKRKPPAGPVVAEKPIDWSSVKVTATATLHGRRIVKRISGFGPIKVAVRPKVLVRLRLDPDAANGSSKGLTIAPGGTITALLEVRRNGYNGDLRFDVDHLPHGVIVDNIGLSGILVRAGETKRLIYITASDWVPETTRLIHAVAKGQGNQASPPLPFTVKRKPR
ncbi:MAG: c-type cytochrome domain-containing protein [Planctomycetaceae bacterium]